MYKKNLYEMYEKMYGKPLRRVKGLLKKFKTF